MQILLGEGVTRNLKGAGFPRRLRAVPPSRGRTANQGSNRGTTRGSLPGQRQPPRSPPERRRAAAYLQAEASAAGCERAAERGPAPPSESPCPRRASAGRGAGRSVLRPEMGDAPFRAMRFAYIVHTGVLIWVLSTLGGWQSMETPLVITLGLREGLFWQTSSSPFVPRWMEAESCVWSDSDLFVKLDFPEDWGTLANKAAGSRD